MTKNPQQNMIKIEIENRWTGEVIYTHECEDNTIRKTVEQAVKDHADLRFADLSSADLSSADLHSADLRSADLHSANLYSADLRSADLHSADLHSADLRSADLHSANLYSANLYSADLRSADLHSANLYSADLSSADLSSADLHSADLRFADLSSADLSSADLHSANLYSADINNNNTKIGFVPLACPSDGAFVGWKKVNGKLVKLLIPEDARRSSATTNKCRCDKAKVLSITDIDGSNPVDKIINRGYAQPCEYIVGEVVLPDNFDKNRWNECSNGIHFFVNKQEAINY